MFRKTLLLVLATSAAALAAPFELRDGDRVALIGDTLLERENTFGFLEAQMHAAFPQAKFSVRNIAWAGDTPRGWSRASFDPVEKGWERLKEHIALVKPTVVFLGYGMAASLQEMTDRSRDWRLNPDPARYGREPMSAGRFKKELGELMDEISAQAKANGQAEVRFVLIEPAHSLWGGKPELPDKAMRQELLLNYAKAVRETCRERGARGATPFVLGRLYGSQPVTDNGIHPNYAGAQYVADCIAHHLEWREGKPQAEPLLSAILAKNDLWFHRFRPANSTYLFGFRKHEQGRNAVEMEQFAAPLQAADEEIWRIKSGGAPTAPEPIKPDGANRTNPPSTPATLPEFTLDDGLEISLWASNPMVSKPVQMNWDAQGRLWVASTPIYPQIRPGFHPDDRIFILEDTDKDGKADKTTTFADNLLIPTGVEPDPYFSNGKNGTAAYAGASTELLRLMDDDGDGKSDRREIVLSGFGTEDTHHTIHTLHWGPDGLLYFNQSVYIHSHLETPHGMVRLNAGGVFSYDPRTERVEVFSKGLWNPWGHQMDVNGEHFLTDGAGFKGIAWAFPGAIFNPSEGARRFTDTISPGSYPKFAGLEIVRSPHFPADWQGTAVTCDFRAHRIVRFKINDLAPKKSGFVTSELPDVARTGDVAFRPIDVKLGPDGALYIADWSNPVINHGEVDFRDPRRDHVTGRIWRVARKGQAASFGKVELPPQNYTPKKVAPGIETLRALASTPTAENAALALEQAVKVAKEDEFFSFAAWRTMNDLAEPWVESVLAGAWKVEGREAQLSYALSAIEPDLAAKVMAKLLPDPLPRDGSGPWLDLIGKSGGVAETTRLMQAVASKQLDAAVLPRALDALAAAAERNVSPDGKLRGALGEVFDLAPTASARLAGAWRRVELIPKLTALVAGKDDAARNAAFTALRAIGGDKGKAALRELAAASQPPHLRGQAVAALAGLDLGGSLPLIREALAAQPNEDAAIAVWRGLLSNKGAAEKLAAALDANWPKHITAAGQRAAREAGKAGQPLLTAFQTMSGAAPAAATANVQEQVAALLAGIKQGGDPAEGELVYRRAALACVACHAIAGAGGKVGPELTSLGASAPADYIMESLIAPQAKVKEGFHAVSLTLKDGGAAAGVLVGEAADVVTLRNAVGAEQRVSKSSIVKRDDLGSLMPAGLIDALSWTDKRSLAAFLVQLGKPGPFDASKGDVARVWTLHRDVAALAPTADAATPRAFSLVNGTLPNAQLAEAAQMAGIADGAFLAVARFQTTAAGELRLDLKGVQKAWINGEPLATASEPNPRVTLPAGKHTLTIKLDAKQLPDQLRATIPGARFLTD